MSHKGWIKLYRKIQDHWLYQEKRKFSKFEAWLDLLMMASHEDKKFVLGNELVEIKRGQFVTSELKLMERWKWGKSKLRSFLEILEKDGMITKKSDRKKTVITICNYSIYQDYETENRPQSDHNRTDSRLLSDTIKNYKNDKNNIYTPEFEEWWKLYPRKVEKKRAFTAFKKAIKTNNYDDLLDGLKGYVQYIEQNKIEERFIKHASTFLNGESFKDFIDREEDKKVVHLTEEQRRKIKLTKQYDEVMDKMNFAESIEEIRELEKEAEELRRRLYG